MNPTLTLSTSNGFPIDGVELGGHSRGSYRAACPNPRCIVDVGANLGAHVAQFVDMGCPKILAFEPIPELAGRLARLHQRGPVTVHQLALGEAARRATYYIDTEVLAESGLKGRIDRPDRVREQVPVTVATLDSFGLDVLDYIKMDAEGAELLVLSGAEATVGRCRPLIWWSMDGPVTILTVCRRIRCSIGQLATSNAVCDLFGGQITPELFDQCVDRYYWDYLLVPGENRELAERLEAKGESLLRGIGTFIVG